jgi:hypothetical protein
MVESDRIGQYSASKERRQAETEIGEIPFLRRSEKRKEA